MVEHQRHPHRDQEGRRQGDTAPHEQPQAILEPAPERASEPEEERHAEKDAERDEPEAGQLASLSVELGTLTARAPGGTPT